MSPKTHQRGSQPSMSQDLTPNKKTKLFTVFLQKILEGRPNYNACIFNEANFILAD
jgi:hypothetical protein